MASVGRRGDAWEVRWSEKHVIQHDDGTTETKWKSRRRRAPTKAAAESLAREIETAKTHGERWTDAREAPIATFRSAALGWVKSAVRAGLPDGTCRWRSSMAGAWLEFLGARYPDSPQADRTVAEWSLTLLEAYADSLPSDGRKASTRYRKVMAAEQIWRWAHNRPEAYPGVPIPRRLTGRDGEMQAPPPVQAVAAPTFEQVDKMLVELDVPWHHQAAVIMRYTGLRISQVLHLQGTDLDLDRAVLSIPSGRPGAKRSDARVVPVAPRLVAFLRPWVPRIGLVFPSPRGGGVRGSDSLRDACRAAWAAAEVDPRVWDAIDEGPGKRAHARPTHAIRACLRTELLRAGVAEPIVLHLLGHQAGHTQSAYVPQSSPEQSPWWSDMQEAVAGIPSHRKVIPLEEAGS